MPLEMLQAFTIKQYRPETTPLYEKKEKIKGEKRRCYQFDISLDSGFIARKLPFCDRTCAVCMDASQRLRNARLKDKIKAALSYRAGLKKRIPDTACALHTMHDKWTAASYVSIEYFLYVIQI